MSILKKNIKELEEKLEMCENQYYGFIQDAEYLKEECVDAIIDKIKDFCRANVEYKVKTEVKITNSLGLDNLRKLKNDMNMIIDKMDDKRQELSSNKNVWIINVNSFVNLDFKKINLFGVSHNSQQLIKKNILDEMRYLTSDIGNLLNEYGYINLKENGEWEKENERIIYAYALSTENKTIFEAKQQEYVELFEETLKKFEEIYKLKKDLEQTKALYLWEQA